jgi:RND superfamily putative drug exporter
MLARVAEFAVRRRRTVLGAVVMLLVLAAVTGGGVADRLGSSGFAAPGNESTRAAAVVDRSFAGGPPNLVLYVRPLGGGLDSPAVVAAGRVLTARLAAEDGVGPPASYWVGGVRSLRAADGRSALVVARVVGDQDTVKRRMNALYAAYSGRHGAINVQVGGQPAAERELNERSQHDLERADAVAAPLVLLILLLVFGSAVAALLPLTIGLVAVLGTLAVLRLLTAVTEVSIFALNITTALGFGLAIDYGLFVVTRFREERDGGLPVAEAVVVATTTAGRTVLFSALTVALSLSSLLVFPLYFLRSFAYAGIAVVALAALSAVIVLPALLAVFGHRVDALDVRAGLRRLLRMAPRSPGSRTALGAGFWHRLALFVMRYPVPIAIGVIVLLVGLGAPFLRASFALPDDRLLPRASESHLVAEALRTEFVSTSTDTAYVVAPRVPPAASGTAELTAYATEASRQPHVSRVDGPTGSFVAGRRVGPGQPRFSASSGRTAWFAVTTPLEGYSAAAERLAGDLRRVHAGPGGLPVLVGGNAAHLLDTKATLRTGLPWALGIVGFSTLVVLFLFTGSVLIPVKAIGLNLLSLTATFGAMVWGFQEGHLRPLVGDFLVTGTLELTTPILMFCIAFGLSMDYEVFLLSRIREEYQATGDNTAAVALGLERTGRLVTSAALLIVVVLLALTTSSVTLLKLLGVGLALAVAMDATLVRGLLVPAIMRLAGPANWWAPAPLRRLHGRIGLREGPPMAAEEYLTGRPAAPG